MIETLQPSTLGEILDRTVETYRSRFLVFLGIAWLPAGMVLASALTVFLFFAWMGTEGQGMDPGTIAVLSLLFLAAGGLLLLPLCAAASSLGAGALNHAAMAAFYREPITIRGAYHAAWKHGWRYIGLFLLEALFVFIAPAVVGSALIAIFGISAMGPPSGAAGDVLGGATLLLLLALMVYGVWMLLMVCLSFPASVAEDAPAWTAFKRAIALSKGTRGRILVLYILGIVLRWGLSFLLTIPVILIIVLVPGLDTPQHGRLLGTIFLFVIYGGSFAVRAFTKPVYAIAQLHFYFDQRIRKEGFDIEWMMRQAGLVQAPATSPEAALWMPTVPSRPSASAAPAEPIPDPPSVLSAEPPVPVPAGAPGEAVEPPPAGEPA